MLTVERLRELLDYDPETGVFTWRCRRANRPFEGRIAGSTHKRGYVVLKIEGKSVLAHRAAWAHYYGAWPEHDLDHQDTDKTNQRISNLRPATDIENGYNRRTKKDNTSGYKGVSVHTQTGRWQARIVVNKKRMWLGFFDTAEEAHAAYVRAAQMYHGEYARIS